jgi:polyhydroxyalkanoate synthesis regulator phasin
LSNFKRRFLLFLGITLCVTVFSIMSPDNAKASDNQEQVVVSPAQQAVNSALSTATTEVQQAVAATDTATAVVANAQTEFAQAQGAVSTVTQSVTSAQTGLALVDTAIATINAVDLTTTPIDQSSQTVQDAKATITTAQTAIDSITVTTAQTELTQATIAKTAASTAQATAQTELTQANIAIDNAQTAVNNLQATIGTSTNVLAGVDDAGVQMNLPFGMQMGGTVYNNVYVGSNATITFGVNEGPNYYSTPNAPSVSIAGWDWTTWSTGTGITYASTGTSLDIAWDLRPYPQQDASTQMVQVRFNADVNPNDGAWIATVSANGPIPNGARFNYRETTNGEVTEITDTNTGTGFAGQISQGTAFTPYVDPNTETVQAAVDAANATIAQLNSSLTPVVTQNTTNTSAINAINTASLTNTLNSSVSTKTSLQSTLNTKAGQLVSAINNNIPTPAPILAEPIIAGTTVTIAPELPSGYTANTWFYQVVTDDLTAENPYAGGTYNTDGAPESIELSGLTEGATYTVRVANWSGPVSNYTETVISIPVTQSANLNGGGAIQPPPAEEPPAEEPPAEEPPAEEPPAEEPPAEEPPAEEPPAEEPPAEEPPAEEEEAPLTVEEIISVVEDLVTDGNLTAADAEAVLDALMSDGEITSSEISTLTDQLISDGTLSANESALVLDALNSDGVVTNSEVTSLVEALVSEGGLSANEAELIVDALSADGDITTSEVNNLSDALTQDGSFTLAEKDLVSEVLITAAEGAPVTAANIEAAGLEYRDLPPTIPVEVREDANGNPVVIQAEVASALLVLESPAAIANAIATCFNPDEAIEGLTEEEKCELGKALLSMGADMSIPEREKAEDIVVVTVIAGQIVLGTAYRRRV